LNISQVGVFFTGHMLCWFASIEVLMCRVSEMIWFCL